MFEELYQFIVHPAQFVQDRKSSPTKAVMFFSLFLVSLAFSAGAERPLISGLFWFIIFILMLVFYSAILDFIAQLFSLKPQSNRLFYTLGLAYLPYCLTVPIDLLGQSYSIFYFLSIVPFVLSAYLELTIIKGLYDVSYKKSLLIWSIPMLSFLGVTVGIIVLGVGAVL